MSEPTVTPARVAADSPDTPAPEADAAGAEPGEFARYAPPAEGERVRLRSRSLRVLVAGVALGSTGHIAAVTVAPIVASQLAGTSALSGVPGAAVVLGAAVGASALSALMARRGRRPGISLGYTIGVLGAFVAIAATVAGVVPVLMAGMFLIGFGNSSNQLSRYVAADMYPFHRRAATIGTVVWAATVGAVLGPNLVGPSGAVASALGLPPLTGAYLVPIAFVGAAAVLSFVLLRPDPFALADTVHDPMTAAATSIRDLVRRPTVAAALIGLVASQVVMVLIMTMTPVHMTAHGHHVETVGLVISGHTFGMYALSPLSGRLTDRFGSPTVIAAGLIVTASASVLAAVAPPDGGVLLFLALFLLGYGWNLGFVAGSTMLTRGVDVADRTRLQGAADSLIWSSSALASLSSGVVLAFASYAALGLLGAALVVIPLWIIVSRRPALSAAT
ncbi:MAG: MFS transporter [Chloroflexota bacterium]